MKRRVLIIDDSAAFVGTATNALETAGYRVECAVSGEAGRRRASEQPWDLVVAGWNVTGLSGEKLVRSLRAEVSSPLVLVATQSTAAERVAGFRAGGDDFLPRSIAPEELVARIEAHFRRYTPAGGSTRPSGPFDWLDTTRPDFQFGDFTLSYREGQLRRSDLAIPLSHQEFRLLCLFSEHPYEVLSMDRILSEAWGYDAVVTSRTVYVHVAWLRKKLRSQAFPESPIGTVRGLGYVFRP